MSQSSNTHRRIVWTVRVLLALAFGAAGSKLAGGNPVPAIVLAVLSGFVAYRLRPAGGVLAISGAAR